MIRSANFSAMPSTAISSSISALLILGYVLLSSANLGAVVISALITVRSKESSTTPVALIVSDTTPASTVRTCSNLLGSTNTAKP